LIDETEQSLKSMEDYRKAVEHSLRVAPQLKEYLKKYLIPFPGDWPTWLYCKKIIAQTTNESDPMLCLIPEQGPFHVSLNLQEQIILQYHFLFDELHQHLYSRPLQQKPVPGLCSLLLSSLLLGWLMIREKIIQKFNMCKDVEYVIMLFLLDEILPLGFFQYTTMFCSGDLDNYVAVMVRVTLLFIIWKRRHYNRSSISMLSDIKHQMENVKDYFQRKKDWLALFTEKKVEIFHSELRSNIAPWLDAEAIKKIAKCVSAQRFQMSFKHNFVNNQNKNQSVNRDWSVVAGASAEYLLRKFKKIANNIGKAIKVCFYLAM